MSSFSGYTPVYVRSSGNDSSGDGSLASPYLTVKKGFEKAFAGVGGSMSSSATPHVITVAVPESNNPPQSSAQTTTIEIADSTGTSLNFTLSIGTTAQFCTGSYSTTVDNLSAAAGASSIVSYLQMQGLTSCGYSFSNNGSQLTITGPTPGTDDIEWNDTTKQFYTNTFGTNETFSLSGDAIANTISNTSSVVGQDTAYVAIYFQYYDINTSSYVDYTYYTSGSDSNGTASSFAGNINSSISSYVTASTSGNILTITSVGVGSSNTWLQAGNTYSITLISGNISGGVSESSNTSGSDGSLAIAGSGNYVIDVGSGIFSGFSLNDNFLTSPTWPSRIAIIGSSESATTIGDISGDAVNYVASSGDDCIFENQIDPCSLNINSNKTITMGNISSNGIGLATNNCSGGGGPYSPNAGNGASIYLSGVVCNNITSNGGIINVGSLQEYRPQGDGGDITLIDTVCSGINTNGSNGGDISLTNCKIYSNISSSGLATYDIQAQNNNTFPAMSGGLNGNIILAGSTNIPDTIIGNVITASGLNRGRGVNGSNILGIV